MTIKDSLFSKKMEISAESIKKFIQNAKKGRENWLVTADKSWLEIEKKHKNRRLWSTTPNSVRRKARYPAWYSIFKIRQPLLLSRIGIPIGKDTTQDGNDIIGQTAALIKERLAINLVKEFDFFDFLACCRDDFLATNFGFGRAYYEAKEVKEKVKKRVTEVPPEEEGGTPAYYDEEGNEVDSILLKIDDEGFFIETKEVTDVTEERVYLEHVLYKNVYVDPTIRRWNWNRIKQIAFEERYSEAEFRKIFGKEALKNLPKNNDDGTGKDFRRNLITVYEYWDLYEKQCAWVAEEGEDLIYPKDYVPSDDSEEKLNGLYNLTRFYPVPTPLISNQSTYEFWPITEYYQLSDVIDDIHTIFSRIVQCTRAIRARVLFDNNVEGLKEALNEAAEGDAIGVTNLSQSLVNSGGSLDGVVQYVPIEKLIESIQQLYQSLEQRLNVLYKLTGTSDLLQGLITDPTQRTFGERQMTEKYALNQLAEPQRRMQEFVRDCYELLCEMAIKNFKDESLDRYMMPETLQPDNQQVYNQARELLKNNHKRFRIELETDSTIALNEEFDKQVRLELTQALTSGLEKTAQIAQQSPELVVPELHALKYLIQGFRQGKLFQTEITQAIDNVIQKAQQPPATPPFNKEEADHQLKQQELQLKTQEAQMGMQLEQAKLQSDQQLELAKLQGNQQVEFAKLQQSQAQMEQDERIAVMKAQFEAARIRAQDLKDQTDAYIEQMKMRSNSEINYMDAHLENSRLQTQVALAQEELMLKRDELAASIQGTVTEAQLKQLRHILDSKTLDQQMQLAQAQYALEAQKVMLDEKEKFATEARLQAEHDLQQMKLALSTQQDLEKNQLEIQKQKGEIASQIMSISPEVQMIKPKKKKKIRKKIKIIRDEFGNIQGGELEKEEIGEDDTESPMEDLNEGGEE